VNGHRELASSGGLEPSSATGHPRCGTPRTVTRRGCPLADSRGVQSRSRRAFTAPQPECTISAPKLAAAAARPLRVRDSNRHVGCLNFRPVSFDGAVDTLRNRPRAREHPQQNICGPNSC